MRWLKKLVLVIAAITLPMTVVQGQTQESHGRNAKDCSHSEMWKPAPEELDHILANHRKWLAQAEVDASAKAADLCKAILNGTNLNEVDLKGANLNSADLRGVKLERAVLSHADLRWAKLDGANLRSVDLNDAQLNNASLTSANMGEANLTNAKLGGADLTKADLRWAVLAGAILDNTNVTDTRFASARLTGAIYSITEGPPASYVADIKDLATIRFPVEGETGLVQLQDLLQKSGLRQLEREVTYAIERGRTWHKLCQTDKKVPEDLGKLSAGVSECSWRSMWRSSSVYEGVFRLVFFEWTTGYGLYPGRALGIIIGCLVVSVLFYVLVIWTAVETKSYPHRASRRWAVNWMLRSCIALRQSLAHGRIYQVWPRDSIEVNARIMNDGSVVMWSALSSTQGPKITNEIKIELLKTNLRSAIGFAIQFALSSAFRMGWREFNVGTWISQLRTCEYTLRATGFVQFISGTQSLLSAYLLAIWALTYFGRPFQ
jgi:uncharacterized protein YjbI with pentapeptide repeats